MATQPSIGVLLINVGTPDAPEVPEVRRYLRQFLSDPYVIDINPVARWLLLNLIILPRRPAKSAAAYRKVWLPEGSPLTVHGQAMATRLEAALGGDYKVLLGHRYGNPSMESSLQQFRDAGIDRIILFPLYPQYAASSTGTSLRRVFELLGDQWTVPQFSVVSPFYDDPGFIDAITRIGTPIFEDMKPDRVLFSYHGLPERHVTRCDDSGAHCLASPTCCDAIVQANRNCYKAQSYANARLLAASMSLDDDAWSVSFQSRLGRTPWIKPYTDLVVNELAEQGVKKLLVFVSSFVADCLETLEEIGIRAQEDFIAHGGEELRLVPAVNAHPRWIEAAAELVRRQYG